MKSRIFVIIAALIVLCLVAFALSSILSGDTSNNASSSSVTEGEDMVSYKSITMQEAKEIFSQPGDYVILDVRRPEEYAAGHIPGAINYANENITTNTIAGLEDLNKTVYVYCRSGNRSKQASSKLARIGYTNIIEFGGIIDWTGEIERSVSNPPL